MTDKELLELAAKAAGYIVEYGHEWWYEEDLHLNGRVWNPLTDDGDSLRLAVKLELMINPIELGILKNINVYDGGDVDMFQLVDGDPYAATRRAIVRAAAEIGKTL